MRWFIVAALCAVLAMPAAAFAKATQRGAVDFKFRQSIAMPANPPEIGGSMFQAAAVNTTVLGWWQFDNANGTPNEQGWTKVDKTAQIAEYFHVDGNPGCHGIQPINGQKSMWCGQWATTLDPWCGWATLPGYGNGWDQSLVSGPVSAATLQWSWVAVWNSEAGYDGTFAEYYDNAAAAWVSLPVNGGAGYYDGTGGPLSESFQVTPPGGSTQLRFHFISDGGWSDEDGLSPSNEGGFKVDDILVTATGFSNGPQTFETAACGAKSSPDGFWTADSAPAFGDFAALRSAAGIVQEDPCLRPFSNMWGFFDAPTITNYACGGWPLQGAMRYGPDASGLYLWNEIWSPWIPNTGSGTDYQIEFLTYRDLPLDNLQFYMWEVRTRDATGCPGPWSTDWVLYFGDVKDWFPERFQIGAYIPGSAVDIQFALGAIDACPFWCGIYGTGGCHSHAPIIDQARFCRIDFVGPQWMVQDFDLFQDNFPENGEIVGVARCDAAQDILPGGNAGILPGDSLIVEVGDPAGIAVDPSAGGPAVYVFVKVTDRFGAPVAGKSGLAIQSPDNVRFAGDPNAGTLRYPLVGPASAPPGLPAGWSQYRMDFVYTRAGNLVTNYYCADLMDVSNGKYMNENPSGNVGVFSPGDVINYFLGAKNAAGQWSYVRRTFGGQGRIVSTQSLTDAVNDAMEWSVLPDAGRQPGDLGDILFVDDADDRGGPAQLYFDWAFRYLGLEDRVDRFDVLGPSSCVGNSLASRVKNVYTQIIGDPMEVYQKILWNSTDLPSGLIGDGGVPNGGSSAEKSDDFGLLFTFLQNHIDNPGVYAAGDDMAEDWAGLMGLGAINVRSIYMNFSLSSGSHVAMGEPISPLLTKEAASPIGPSTMYVYGGCPLINDFDVIQPTGTAFRAMRYPTAGRAAVVAQATPNAAATTARFVLSGAGYNFIRDDATGGPPDRVIHLRDILAWFQNDVGEPIGIDPLSFENRLGDNYPNPFNPVTTIEYAIAERGRVTLRIYDVAGRLVRTLIDEEKAPVEGGFTAAWDGRSDAGAPAASGVYFYRLTAKGYEKTKKMVLLR